MGAQNHWHRLRRTEPDHPTSASPVKQASTTPVQRSHPEKSREGTHAASGTGRFHVEHSESLTDSLRARQRRWRDCALLRGLRSKARNDLGLAMKKVPPPVEGMPWPMPSQNVSTAFNPSLRLSAGIEASYALSQGVDSAVGRLSGVAYTMSAFCGCAAAVESTDSGEEGLCTRAHGLGSDRRGAGMARGCSRDGCSRRGHGPGVKVRQIGRAHV